MVLKVDLQCPRCYKKIKKILCEFPEIRDQVYDEKQNTVTITVVCCSPEMFRGKLCCKGGKTIKCIEIVVPPPPPAPPPAPSPPPAPPCHCPPPPKPCHCPPKPCHCPPPTKPCHCPPPPPPPPCHCLPPPKPCHCPPKPCHCPPPPPPKPCNCGCGRSAPCCDSHRSRPRPQPCYCGCGRSAPCYDDCSYGKPSSASVYYFSDENPSACTIM